MKLINFTRIIATVLIFIAPVLTKAQDLIIKTDKTEIKSKVLEITDDAIKYKKFEALDGPTYSVKKVLVFMILYKNGTKEYMDNPTPPAPVVNNTPNTQATPGVAATKTAQPESETTWDPLRLLTYFSSSSAPDGFGGSVSSTSVTVEFTRDFKVVPDYFNIGLGPVLSVASVSVPDYTFKNGVPVADGSTSSSSSGYGLLVYGSGYVSLAKLLNNNQSGGKGFYAFARLGYEYISSSDDSGDSLSAGSSVFEFGVDYKISKNFSVTAVTSKFNAFGGGISFRF